jgi:hypothetical protein
MLVTMPLMCRVVSVHRLYTAISSGPCRWMSCSTVSDVNVASSPPWWAWMSCEWVAGYLERAPTNVLKMQRMLSDPPPKPVTTMSTLWSALLQAFTVEDVFHRKIK